MKRRNLHNLASWLCLVAFVFAGPLEGDEPDWGLSDQAPQCGLLAANAQPGALSILPAPAEKDPTIDSGYLCSIASCDVPPIAPATAPAEPGALELASTGHGDWLASRQCLGSLRTVVLLT